MFLLKDDRGTENEALRLRLQLARSPNCPWAWRCREPGLSPTPGSSAPRPRVKAANQKYRRDS